MVIAFQHQLETILRDLPAAVAAGFVATIVFTLLMYYGAPVMDVAKLKTLRGPLLGIWGNQDKGITPEVVAAFDKALTEAGVKHEFHAYDAGHGFANPSSHASNPEAAKDAGEKTIAFLKANLR